jgi:CRISPR-associated protein Cas6
MAHPNYWQEEDPNETFQVPDDVFDVAFKLVGSRLAVDHAQSLANAVCAKLSADSHSQIGIHQVRVAESGNGWERPSSAGEMLHLSRRTKLVLRVNQGVYEDVLRLSDSELEIDGQLLKVGVGGIRKLSLITTLFSHGIACDEAQAEGDFLADIASASEKMEIKVKKMICGRTHSIRSDKGSVFTRALMVANLTAEESVLLQQNGIGGSRLFGCGLFVPHRGIDAVFATQE